MLEKFFRLSENHTTARTELLAGITTFLTMAYIIFVQPSVLSGKMFGIDTGIDFGAVTTATCLSAALATAIMALYARYPIAQAPGMGENLFFVFAAIAAAAAAGFPNPWAAALGRSSSPLFHSLACRSARTHFQRRQPQPQKRHCHRHRPLHRLHRPPKRGPDHQRPRHGRE